MSSRGSSVTQNMTALERAAWVYMAETGRLREFLWRDSRDGPGGGGVEKRDIAYETRLHQEAIRIGALLRSRRNAQEAAGGVLVPFPMDGTSDA